MNSPFYYKNNRLFCENVDISAFAKTVPSPFYIYSKSEILNNCNDVWQANKELKADFLPCYALKANYNPTLLKLIQQEKFGADIVSGGELYFARKAGYAADKTVFAGVGKTAEEIREAIAGEIHSINIESEAELHLVAQLAEEAGKTQQIAIRVNPDIEAKTHAYISTGLHTNKFGVSTEQAFELFVQAQKYRSLKAHGIHVHIGSQIETEAPFNATADFLKIFIERLKKERVEIKFLDLGGGIGINYEDPLTQPEKERTFLKTILPQYLQAFSGMNLKLYVELGRSIIGSAGILISKVVIRKKTPLKNFMIVDAAMNNLIRPSLYQAAHQIVPVEREVHASLKVDVVGPVCESGDFLAKDIQMEDVQAGEHIAIASAGAYGQALSSHYNLRPAIREYLVDDTKVECIFKGRSVQEIASAYRW